MNKEYFLAHSIECIKNQKFSLNECSCGLKETWEYIDSLCERLVECEKVMEQAEETLRAVRSDRPSVHSEQIWLKMFSTLEAIEAYKSAHPTEKG